MLVYRKLEKIFTISIAVLVVEPEHSKGHPVHQVDPPTDSLSPRTGQVPQELGLTGEFEGDTGMEGDSSQDGRRGAHTHPLQVVDSACVWETDVKVGP